DPEDCANTSACNGTNSGVLSTFNITSIRSNTRLFYDYGGTSGVEEIVITNGAEAIPEFEASKMVIYGELGQGDMGNEFGFTYSITDRAGISSEPVLYEIMSMEPLPLKLLSFNAVANNNTSLLSW